MRIILKPTLFLLLLFCFVALVVMFGGCMESDKQVRLNTSLSIGNTVQPSIYWECDIVENDGVIAKYRVFHAGHEFYVSTKQDKIVSVWRHF